MTSMANIVYHHLYHQHDNRKQKCIKKTTQQKTKTQNKKKVKKSAHRTVPSTDLEVTIILSSQQRSKKESQEKQKRVWPGLLACVPNLRAIFIVCLYYDTMISVIIISQHIIHTNTKIRKENIRYSPYKVMCFLL